MISTIAQCGMNCVLPIKEIKRNVRDAETANLNAL